MRDEAEACSEMVSSLTIDGAAKPSGATIFSNEACDGVQAMGDYVPSSLTLPQVDLQDIKAYFQRPRLLRRGNIPFGTRSGINSYPLTVAGMAIDAFPQWTQRTSGAYGVRFTTVFRLQVAATSFHQGIVTLSFQYGMNGGLTTDYNRALNPATATNIPHVRLDLSENTMVELRVPFLYPTEFVPVSGVDDFGGAIGTLGLNSLLPVVSVSGMVVPTYELYITLEDIEFFGVNNPATSTIVLQAGVFSMANELRETKLVSKTLDTGAKIASFVSRHVPMLSAVAGPTSWFLDQAAGVAKYFGFARPMIQEPPVRVVRGPYAAEGQVDMPFCGFPVGPFQSNSLAITPDVGATNVDEMSLAFVTSQWSQINLGLVSNGNAHGTTVYATPVCMSCFWFRSQGAAPFCNVNLQNSYVGVAGNCQLPSTLMYIASFFRLWRGSIEFRITFAKTKFHGGRYMLYYDPGTDTGTVNRTFTTINGPEINSNSLIQPYGYSKIIDLKDDNVFEFSVPYVSERPYSSFFTSTGGFSMTCIDPLQNNNSISSTVPFLVEVRGGPDFELADYTGSFLKPYPNSNVVFVTQSGEFSKINDAGPSTLNPVVKTATKDPSQLTIGEKFMSVKQLIQIPTYSNNSIAANTTSVVTVPPWFVSNSSAQYGTPTIPMSGTVSHTGTDHSPPALAQMYNFARGSTDLHIYNQGASVFASVDQLPNIGSSVAYAPNTAYGTYSNIASTPKVLALNDAPLHVRLPAFQTLVRIFVGAFGSVNFTRLLGSSPTFVSYDIGHFARLKVSNSNSVANNILIGFAAGDDATLASFRGPPPIMLPNSASPNALSPSWN